MKIISYLLVAFFVPLFFAFSPQKLTAEVGGSSGSVESTISGGTTSAPTYKIATASNLGDPVYVGAVSAVSGYSISFDTFLDDSNVTVYPFLNDNVFIKTIEMPNKSTLLATVSSGSVTGGTVNYSTASYGTKVGFSANKPPAVIVSPSDGGGTTAKLTATLDSSTNLISGFTVVDGGTGYNSAPQISIVGGPHLVRIIDEDSNSTGKCFLIEDNNQTTLHLDSTLSANEYFEEGTLIEVVAAPTIGSIFGVTDVNVTSATRWSTLGTEDWVYVYDIDDGGYNRFSHIDGTGGDGLQGWYSENYGYRYRKNNTVIYPDQAFIFANRTSGTTILETDIVESSGPAQILLPEAGEYYIANNPFGMDVMLAEIIPSTAIGTSTTQFNPGSSSSSLEKDTITLISGVTWKTFYYDADSTNSAITEMMKVEARSGSGGSNALTATDLFIGLGNISAVETCTSASGSGATTNGIDGNWTKITASGITRDLTGFTINLSDIQGYMLNAEGTHEVNATTGENVDTNGTGSVVYSNISGSYEVVGGASGYVVIEKQRDINFKSDEGSPAWTIGDAGTGYTTTAKWWAIGGGGSGASGTVNSSGTSFTVTAGGSGYSSAPQIVISGGGWRQSGGDSSPRGNDSISASEGIIIKRHKDYSGVRSFIEATNPAD